MRTNKRWTADEHSTLEKTIKDAVSKGEKLSKAYKQAAFKTGRTVEACKWRWKNIVQTSAKQTKVEQSNLKIANFPKKSNVKLDSVFSAFPQYADAKEASKIVEDLFGVLFGKDISSIMNKPNKGISNIKDHDISNLSVYPMFGSNLDYAVVDDKTKEAYIVCILSEDVHLCSCQKSLFANSNCKHVRKLKSDKAR
ncbi:hypothetical protein D3C76_532730 [compost metagenome]